MMITNNNFEKLYNLVYSYNVYARYIEDYDQEMKAERKNEKIIREIQKIAPITAIDIWMIKANENMMENLKTVLFKKYEIEIEKKAKRIWTEDEIIHHIKTNDKVLYGALLKLYACQTAEEQMEGNAKVNNGAGFNGVDAPILTSFSEFLKKTGFLTYKQKLLCRKKLIKYRKQLTFLANC